jgi:hypothetical protein
MKFTSLVRFMLLGAVLTGMLANGAAARAEDTGPSAVLVLTEEGYPAFLDTPWPTELRLVAYDNGLIIRQPVRLDDPRKKPHFVWQQRTPAEVIAWAAKVKAAALDHVELTDRNVPLPFEESVTILQYWDAESESLGLARLQAYGLPCRAAEDESVDEGSTQIRQATNPRFLELCDALLRLPLDDAKEWHPAEMVVSLLVDNQAPDALIEWPDGWPAKWRELRLQGYTKVELCVPVGPQPNAITAQILDPQSEVWSRRISVKRVGSEWWMVTPDAAEIAMPGEVLSWFRGPCSTDPHFR